MIKNTFVKEPGGYDPSSKDWQIPKSFLTFIRKENAKKDKMFAIWLLKLSHYFCYSINYNYRCMDDRAVIFKSFFNELLKPTRFFYDPKIPKEVERVLREHLQEENLREKKRREKTKQPFHKRKIKTSK